MRVRVPQGSVFLLCHISAYSLLFVPGVSRHPGHVGRKDPNACVLWLSHHRAPAVLQIML